MGKPAVSIALSAAERRELESLARARKTGQAMARRARIVLAATAGPGNKGDLRRGRRGREHGGKWRRRFAEHRLNGMLEVPRPGTPPQDR